MCVQSSPISGRQNLSKYSDAAHVFTSSDSSSGSSFFSSSFSAGAASPPPAPPPPPPPAAAIPPPPPAPTLVIKSSMFLFAKSLANSPGQYGSIVTLAAEANLLMLSAYMSRMESQQDCSSVLAPAQVERQQALCSSTTALTEISRPSSCRIKAAYTQANSLCEDILKGIKLLGRSSSSGALTGIEGGDSCSNSRVASCKLGIVQGICLTSSNFAKTMKSESGAVPVRVPVHLPATRRKRCCGPQCYNVALMLLSQVRQGRLPSSLHTSLVLVSTASAHALWNLSVKSR